VRKASKEDSKDVFELVKGLSEYENLDIDTDEKTLGEAIERGHIEALLCYSDDAACGMVTFFHDYSTFGGYRGMYLEDLFVMPEFRGSGIGRMMLSELARIALERGCKRMSWTCLDWNEPSIGFYESLGAKSTPEWVRFAMPEDRMRELLL